MLRGSGEIHRCPVRDRRVLAGWPVSEVRPETCPGADDGVLDGPAVVEAVWAENVGEHQPGDQAEAGLVSDESLPIVSGGDS